jgi:hypothetical protein
MSTRATIEFKGKDISYYAYCSCDGYPDDVINDIRLACDELRGRPYICIESLLTLFLSMNYDFKKNNHPRYEINRSIYGDEDYVYLVTYDAGNMCFNYSLVDEKLYMKKKSVKKDTFAYKANKIATSLIGWSDNEENVSDIKYIAKELKKEYNAGYQKGKKFMERYKRISNSKWFHDSYDDKSIGDNQTIDD